MFKIADGRESFFQWDLDRKLIVNDKTINEVHFSNKTDECSLTVEVYEEDGLRYADVPNILLQDNWRINVYGYNTNHTVFKARFDVLARRKPADYVYTETEIKNYDDLKARVDEIEKNGVSEEAIGAAVENYLEENPIEIPETDLSNYYNKQETNAAIESAQPNLEPYALKTEIPAAPDLSGYATEKYVDEAIANIDIPEQEGTAAEEIYISAAAPSDPDFKLWINPTEPAPEYALKSDLESYALKTQIPDVTGFTTMAAVEAKGYQTAEQVNTLINTALGVIENGTY